MGNNKTYIIAGTDLGSWGGTAFYSANEIWKKRAELYNDAEIIEPESQKTIEQSLEKIGSGYVIINSHGAGLQDGDGINGGIRWAKESVPVNGETQVHVSYDRIFNSLHNKNISVVAITACKGESAMKSIDLLPAGTILISSTNSEQDNERYMTTQTNSEIAMQPVNPLTIILKTLDNVKPDIASENIGIAGKPYLIIPIKKEIIELAKNNLDQASFNRLPA